MTIPAAVSALLAEFPPEERGVWREFYYRLVALSEGQQKAILYAVRRLVIRHENGVPPERALGAFHREIAIACAKAKADPPGAA